MLAVSVRPKMNGPICRCSESSTGCRWVAAYCS